MSPAGGARYEEGPLQHTVQFDTVEEHEESEQEVESDGTSIQLKGDFVPDFDYATFSAEVFQELYSVISMELDATMFEDGEILLRFVAFNRQSDWSLETRHDSVWDLVHSTKFRNLEFTSDDDEETDTEISEDTPANNIPTDVDSEELMEVLEDADEEQLAAVKEILE